MRVRTNNKFASLILFIVVLVVAIVMKTTFASPDRYSDYTAGTATIVNIDNTDDDNIKVYVAYTADGKEYSNKLLDVYTSSWSVGDTVSILYNPADPGDVTGYTPEYAKATGIFYYIVMGVAGLGILVSILRIIRGR